MRRVTAAEAYAAWLSGDVSGQMEYMTEVGKWVDFSFANREGSATDDSFEIWADTFDRRIPADREVRLLDS
ncbi:MAG: hypothetical protein K8L99_19590 [Anaerolineae bacterium]|nr:hypothetical protein [Anaerolineae bacterium]